jgi:hypothetical protein
VIFYFWFFDAFMVLSSVQRTDETKVWREIKITRSYLLVGLSHEVYVYELIGSWIPPKWLFLPKRWRIDQNCWHEKTYYSSNGQTFNLIYRCLIAELFESLGKDYIIVGVRFVTNWDPVNQIICDTFEKRHLTK